MKKNKNLPLTETVYYILLSLLKPSHGYIIMEEVESLSNGEVRMAAGTLYGAIENLLKLKFIQPVKSQDKRRKVYQITDEGKNILYLDMKRMEHIATITRQKLEVNTNEKV